VAGKSRAFVAVGILTIVAAGCGHSGPTTSAPVSKPVVANLSPPAKWTYEKLAGRYSAQLVELDLSKDGTCRVKIRSDLIVDPEPPGSLCTVAINGDLVEVTPKANAADYDTRVLSPTRRYYSIAWGKDLYLVGEEQAANFCEMASGRGEGFLDSMGSGMFLTRMDEFDKALSASIATKKHVIDYSSDRTTPPDLPDRLKPYLKKELLATVTEMHGHKFTLDKGSNDLFIAGTQLIHFYSAFEDGSSREPTVAAVVSSTPTTSVIRVFDGPKPRKGWQFKPLT
jgi:hypothetical protein